MIVQLRGMEQRRISVMLDGVPIYLPYDGLIDSRSAPTSLAVELAQKLGITIVGFARGKRMNVYSYPMRIITESK